MDKILPNLPDHEEMMKKMLEDAISNALAMKKKKTVSSSSVFHYACTITLSPKEKSDELIFELANRLLESKMLNPHILYYEGCYELTKQGIPHCHIYVRTSSAVYRSNLQKLKGFAEPRIFQWDLVKGGSAGISRWRNYINNPTPEDIEHFGDAQHFDYSLDSVQDNSVLDVDNIDNISVE